MKVRQKRELTFWLFWLREMHAQNDIFCDRSHFSFAGRFSAFGVLPVTYNYTGNGRFSFTGHPAKVKSAQQRKGP